MMVFKCPADVVVKATRRVDDDTEYTTLQCLEFHKPAIPAPRPLGYVRMSGITLIFQTYKPSATLATVWSQLDSGQKASIRDQLDAIMVDLRSIPYTAGSTLQRHQKAYAADECTSGNHINLTC
jgi:aminoglycoside phosphotransferase (APT) family kinase protein